MTRRIFVGLLTFMRAVYASLSKTVETATVNAVPSIPNNPPVEERPRVYRYPLLIEQPETSFCCGTLILDRLTISGFNGTTMTKYDGKNVIWKRHMGTAGQFTFYNGFLDIGTLKGVVIEVSIPANAPLGSIMINDVYKNHHPRKIERYVTNYLDLREPPPPTGLGPMDLLNGDAIGRGEDFNCD